MIQRRALPYLLVLVVLSAPAAAASSVPDPTWIAGLYDGADGDELVALVWDQTPAVEPQVAVLPAPAAATRSAPGARAVHGCRVAVPETSRAPPAS